VSNCRSWLLGGAEQSRESAPNAFGGTGPPRLVRKPRERATTNHHERSGETGGRERIESLFVCAGV